MTAGAIVIIENRDVVDQEEMTAYRTAAKAQIDALGVEVLARGGTAVEGEPALENVVVMRWPSEEGFWAWYHGEDYAPLKAKRQAVSNIRLTIVPMLA